jgi:hypothetical protein
MKMIKMLFNILFVIIYMVGIIYTVPLSEFFPYGLTANDEVFPPNDDDSTNALPLPRIFPYFNNNHRQIYLSNNGLFSFLGSISHFGSDTFPLNDDRCLIAGFWSDIDTRGNITSGNEVYYQIYNNSTNTTVFEKATSYVRQYFPAERLFSPTMIITGTWYRVGAYDYQTSLQNTFQIVLATDELRSFCFLLYYDLQWASPHSSSSNDSILHYELYAEAGFNAGDGIAYEMLPYSRTSNVHLLVNISNVNVPGLFVFRIDTDTIAVGGCGNNTDVLFRPRRGSQIGSTALTIQGPCFSNISDGNVKCRFGDSMIVSAIVISNLQAICLSPSAPLPGSVNIYLSINGGISFQLSPNIYTYTPAVYGFSLTDSAEVIIVNRTDIIVTVGDQLTLGWYLSDLTMSNWPNNTTRLEVQMITVTLNNSNGGLVENATTVLKTNIIPILDYQTTSIIIPWISNNTLPTVFFRIIARNTLTNFIYAGMNSALVVLFNNITGTTHYCQRWASGQPLSSTWNQNLLPCPLTLTQARVARCCYEPDSTCMEHSPDPLVNCKPSWKILL